MNHNKIKTLTLTALFTALVIIGSRIYVGTHDTFRFHLGNSMCLLSAFLLSPINAGFASGIGSMLFDIVFYPNGLGCLVTLVTKFLMGYVAGVVFEKSNNVILGGIIGEVVYIILYAIKTYVERRFILSMPLEGVIPILITKVGASVANAIAAIIVSFVVYNLIKRVRIQ